jgi:alpha-glucosidase
MINSRDSEPWSYGEEVEQISRNYIKFRYKLLPYIYSLFYEASVTGLPVQRSLAIDYPHDGRVYDGHFQHEYLFGPSILVAPVESNKDFLKVLLPDGGIWYYLYNGSKHVGNHELIVECPLHRLPVFVKGGAILPMQPVLQHTGETNDQLIVHVYAGLTDSSFDFYEDDGASFDYQKNQFALRKITYSPFDKKIVFQNTTGQYKTKYTKLKLVLHGFDSTLTTISVNGEKKPLSQEINSFFAGLEKYDPIKDPEPAPTESVLMTEFAYHANEIVLHW